MERIAIGIAVAVAMLAIVGCGASDPNGPGDPVTGFVGGWHSDAETTLVTCPGQAPVSSTAPSNDTFARGTTADLALTDTSGCAVLFDVMGTTATARAGQTCTDSSGAVLTIGHWTFTTFGAESASGSVATTDATGAPITCSYTTAGTFTRISQ